VPIRNRSYAVDLSQRDVAGNSPVRMTDIGDGTSNTLLAGESDFMPAGTPSNFGPIWSYGFLYNWSGTMGGINQRNTSRDAQYSTYRSSHSGGANFVLADGSVQFLREGIDPTSFAALGSRNGGEVVTLP
jgi:prepilin-type processing-associated H-X9-DG protein